MSSKYSNLEMMICNGAAILEDCKSIAVGTGAPLAAAMLAQKTHAPNLVILFEAGGVSPELTRIPISVGDSSSYNMSDMAAGMAEIMDSCSRGLVDYSFLGGAQIDQYGNLNSTVIGDYLKPTVRLPGSGGANDFASLCPRTLLIIEHTPKRLVKHVDFITSPGYLDGPGAREEAGLPDDTGPYRVITDLGIMGFDKKTKKMIVESLHPGVDVATIQNNTGFKLLFSESVGQTQPPTQEFLEVLRDKVDPEGFIIGS